MVKSNSILKIEFTSYYNFLSETFPRDAPAEEEEVGRGGEGAWWWSAATGQAVQRGSLVANASGVRVSRLLGSPAAEVNSISHKHGWGGSKLDGRLHGSEARRWVGPAVGSMAQGRWRAGGGCRNDMGHALAMQAGSCDRSRFSRILFFCVTYHI